MTDHSAAVRYTATEISIHHDDPVWRSAETVAIANYWNGTIAPETRQTEARLLWSSSALYVRFDAAQHEPLVVNELPDTSAKTIGLWERDVCEIFIAPDLERPNEYFEFEIAPTGEWLDLGIRIAGGTRETDWDYSSGMESASRVESTAVVMTIKIPWDAFGKSPRGGDVWLGNLFRC